MKTQQKITAIQFAVNQFIIEFIKTINSYFKLDGCPMPRVGINFQIKEVIKASISGRVFNLNYGQYLVGYIIEIKAPGWGKINKVQTTFVKYKHNGHSGWWPVEGKFFLTDPQDFKIFRGGGFICQAKKDGGIKIILPDKRQNSIA